jgi:all-trans-8'-apo-beta-carotenal 15,15'-oxygenase
MGGAALTQLHGRPAGLQVKHPSDADGMVAMVAVSQGRAFFRNRFVRTAAFAEEQVGARTQRAAVQAGKHADG